MSRRKKNRYAEMPAYQRYKLIEERNRVKNKNRVRKELQDPYVTAYGRRRRIVRALQFDSYEDYLKSPLWDSIRQRVLDAANHQCFNCSNKATAVHHNKYTMANLSGQTLDGLFAVCRDCHRKTHRKLLERRR